MTKIEEFERKIIKNGMTDDDFEEYKKLLVRVHGDFLKNQHCYITAYKFPKENWSQAIKLIQYGLDNFNDGWDSRMRAYIIMTGIYFKINDYNNAYKSMLLANAQTTDESYLASNAIELLWIKLYLDNFQYSQDIEKYYELYQKSSDFYKAFLVNIYRSKIAEIVINLHYNKIDKVRELYQEVLEITAPDYKGSLHNILKKHKYSESVNLSPEVIKFLKNIKKLLKK